MMASLLSKLCRSRNENTKLTTHKTNNYSTKKLLLLLTGQIMFYFLENCTYIVIKTDNAKNNNSVNLNIRTMSTASKIYSFFIEPLINIVVPPICILCNNPLAEHQNTICTSCRKKLIAVSPLLSANLLREINTAQIPAIYIGYEYSDILKELMHLFKYERFTSLSSVFAEAIAVQVGKNENIDLILPVPLHPKKKHERGYNQSELIVKKLSELLDIDYKCDVIERKKYTVSQTTLNKNERMQNVGDAFVCQGNVQNKTLLIVDDVITTGSTLKACAQSVLQKGAKSVYLAAVTTPPFA